MDNAQALVTVTPIARRCQEINHYPGIESDVDIKAANLFN